MHDAVRSAVRSAEQSATDPALPHHTYTTPHHTSKHATSTRDVLAAALDELRARGIHNPEQFSHLDADAITRTVAWYDQQNGRVGTGVLVAELRAGGKTAAKRKDAGRSYETLIRSWLNEHFPEYKQPSGNPHPGAITALIRLHHQHGKTGVTKAEHGAEIRDSVRAFNEKWGWS